MSDFGIIYDSIDNLHIHVTFVGLHNIDIKVNSENHKLIGVSPCRQTEIPSSSNLSQSSSQWSASSTGTDSHPYKKQRDSAIIKIIDKILGTKTQLKFCKDIRL